MRLLCLESLQLLDFQRDPPPYATFSYSSRTRHYTFDDFQKHGLTPGDPRSHTLQQACIHADNLGAQWIWNDALCTDTSSDPTLSESFNSLGQIYRECLYWIVYLHDVPSDFANREQDRPLHLARCAWSRDIWTLPRIILCQNAFFFAGDWALIGTKSMSIPQISILLDIDPQVLVNRDTLATFSAAKKIFWATGPFTSGIEDVSYSLLALFGVKMPILYRDGWKAFIRLPAEILKQTKDRSLFLWAPMDDQSCRGLFARSTAEFRLLKNGPDVPCRIKGQIYVHGEAVRIQADFQLLGALRLPPVHSEDGSTCFVTYEVLGNDWVRSFAGVLQRSQKPPLSRVETYWLKFDHDFSKMCFALEKPSQEEVEVNLVHHVPTQEFEDTIDELTCAVLRRFHLEGRRGSIKRSGFLASGHGQNRSKLKIAGSFKNRCMTDYMNNQYADIKHPESLACPYYKEDKYKHQVCLVKNEFESIEDIKQHLYVDHRQPVSCPVCQGRFATYILRNNHLRNERCQPSGLPVAEGLTEQQVDDMSTVNELSESQENAWFRLWNIVFPDKNRPASPFYSDMQGLVVAVLRKFWRKRRQSIVAEVMRQRNLQHYEIQDEEQNLEWLYETVLGKAVEKTLYSLDQAEHTSTQV